MAEELGDFKDLNTKEVQLPITLVRQSEYTGTRSFGGRRHGYRVTGLLAVQRLSINCQCSESDWKPCGRHSTA